ncbi:FAD-dependent oxidoreductase [Chitinophaga sp. 22321]|uniref:FAD-dependent oxidoreductase n=1 Tax=Chitinophaga hostae TaxID=2831022 RepID=A0ABS5IX81_9BACT|nr:FAD-dependent oxidoreductase [Chitinophaga hostae]MBS0027560.1 FAD-dependent oxidoreductase [Chitinophaga hostae]
MDEAKHPISNIGNDNSGSVSEDYTSGGAIKEVAIIIGAGEAGLALAYELLKRTNIKPVILEKSDCIGGASRTINYKGNIIDIGGHSFLSGTERVAKWLTDIMPIQRQDESILVSSDGVMEGEPDGNKIESCADDRMMLSRKHLSHIYFLRSLLSYPTRFSLKWIWNFGVVRFLSVLLSYFKALLFPIKSEKSAEDFIINRVGTKAYTLFFKDYIEKIWDVRCSEIPVEWLANENWDLLFAETGKYTVGNLFKNRIQTADAADLLPGKMEDFLYPKFGSGQLWEEVGRQIIKLGGEILLHHEVKSVSAVETGIAVSVSTIDNMSGETSCWSAKYFFSTISLKNLLRLMGQYVPQDVSQVADRLKYRSLVSVYVLLKRMSIRNDKTGEWKLSDLKDTWLHIHEKDVKVAKIRICNNWSPFIVKDRDTVWIGMEFFCNKGDDFWKTNDVAISQQAIFELEKIGLGTTANVLDSTVIRSENAYPFCSVEYNDFMKIKDFTDNFRNLFLIGKKGKHTLAASSNSILDSIVAVDNVSNGIETKDNIWRVNGEYDFSNAQEKTQKLADLNGKRSQHDGFWYFVWLNPENRILAIISLFAIGLQFVVFKFLYPFAGFINGDSYVYLETAYHNFSINTYPIGYSKILRLISVFTRSDYFMVAFQYLALQASVLSLVFTIFYFYRPGRLTRILLWGFMLFNPVFLYLANYISSDAVFLSLSLTWFTLLLWIMNRPSNNLIIVNAWVLFIAFTVRYNALFYPVISIVALLLTRKKILANIVGFSISLLLIGMFIQFTSVKYKEISGYRQFTPFSGWQMANNALYAYRYVSKEHLKKTPYRFLQIDKLVRNYFDSTRDIRKYPQEGMLASTVYMWAPNSPLTIYMDKKFKGDSTASPLKKWATVAPMMGDYGSFLIRAYPNEYFRYYLVPNALKYYAPPVEFLDHYSTGVDSVNEIAQVWFGYKTKKISTYFKDFKVNILNFFPILTGMMNVVLLLLMASFIFLRGYKHYPQLKRGLILVVVLWAVNFGFSVFASPIALRFQLFPILVSLSFTFLLMEYLVRAAKGIEVRESESDADEPVGYSEKNAV